MCCILGRCFILDCVYCYCTVQWVGQFLLPRDCSTRFAVCCLFFFSSLLLFISFARRFFNVLFSSFASNALVLHHNDSRMKVKRKWRDCNYVRARVPTYFSFRSILFYLVFTATRLYDGKCNNREMKEKKRQLWNHIGAKTSNMCTFDRV